MASVTYDTYPNYGFLSRRALELVGMLLVALAGFVLLSLVSYDPADPSFNRVALVPATNLAGLPGAYVADLLLQTFGFASVLCALAPLVWGVNYLLKQPPGSLWQRITLLMLCLPASAGLFALIPAPVAWPVPIGLGGYVGWLGAETGADLLTIFGFIALAALVTLVSFTLALGLSNEQWRLIGGIVAGACVVVSFRLWRMGRSLWDMVRGAGEMQAGRKSVTQKARKTRFNLAQWVEEKQTVSKKTQKATEAEETVAEKKPSKPKSTAKKQARQATLAFMERAGNYVFPSITLFKEPKVQKQKLSESALSQNARMLESVLDDFGVNGEITNIRPGPVVTLYELEPAPGTKSSRVIGLADDIARSMSALSARIAVIPGRNAIGVELPNQQRETVYFREMLESSAFKDAEHHLPLVLGKDIGGEAVVVDLAKMPHLLVAGTTGSGKSVAINTMIMSLLYRLTPAQCRFIMIDPKMLELSVYQGIPHLLTPVVTEPGKAVVALKWAVKEMENRYRLMSNLGVRNIHGYNKRLKEAQESGETLTRTVQTGFDPDTGKPIIEEVALDMTTLPFIVVIVDEMADLMLVAGKDIEASIQRLAQMARAAGIHIIMATQRPSVDVITGVIKANFPTRISFQVTSRIDSRTILGEMGAEQLLGMGDMLYMSGGTRITRVHGPFASDGEVEAVVDHLKSQGEPNYIAEVIEAPDEDGDIGAFAEGDDADSENALFDQAVAVVCRDGKASTSYIQRKLRIGYNRAATLIERMESEGIVTAPNHVGKREVLARKVDA
jgi:S-DNA-T family DNA segregation ATPase FtsK/SpoIIIE